MSDTNPNPLLAVPETVKVTDATENEIDPAAAATLTAMGILKSGFLGRFWGQEAAAAVDSAATITAILTGQWDKMMALVGILFEVSQGEKNSSFYDLSAKVLQDLTGVPVDAAALKKSAFGSGRLQGMQEFGGDLYKLLEEEFKPTTGNLETPDSGPAERFLGFLMNFAIRQGNVAAMCDAIPEKFKFMNGFREYGELMARNLGLGRMARRALQPLIQTLVADPLQYDLNTTYRPKRLAKEQAIKAWFRGTMELTDLRKELAEEGFSEKRQNIMIGDSRPLLNDRELVHLYYRNHIDLEALTIELKARGWAESTISLLVESERPQMSVSEILESFLYGGLPETDVLTELGKVGYDVETATKIFAGFKARHDPKARMAHVHIRFRSVNQLQREYLDGVIDLFEWEDALIRLGFDETERFGLTQELLIQQAHHKAAGAKQVIPHLSYAQLNAAYKAGILNLTQVEEHLKARGYTPEDVSLLLKELHAPPPPPALPTP